MIAMSQGRCDISAGHGAWALVRHPFHALSRSAAPRDDDATFEKFELFRIRRLLFDHHPEVARCPS